MPFLLPPTDAVEVAYIGPIDGVADDSPYLRAERRTEGLLVGESIWAVNTVQGADATELAYLWRLILPWGPDVRCHLPPYSLRFFRDCQWTHEVTICWACHNIRARIAANPSKELWCRFQGDSSHARRLYSRLGSHVGAL